MALAIRCCDRCASAGTRKGFACVVDPGNASNAENIGHTARNVYHTQDGKFQMSCGNATSPNHNWTLAELQTAGLAKDSVVLKAADLTVSALKAKAETLLGMQ